MKILILGAGKMGSFFTDLLSFDHEVAVLEKDPKRMRFIYNALRLQNPEEVKDFNPELVINCVTLSYTIEAFKAVMPYLQPYCIISDIASVKTYLKEFYETCGFPYVSTHPMFGPHSLIWDNWRKRIRLLSPRAIIWARYSSRIFIPASACISANTRSRSTIKWCLLTRYPFRLHYGICRYDEASGCSGYDVQTPYENRPRPSVRGRLSIDRDPFQPPYPSPNRTDTRGIAYLARNHQG